jgi:small subunit ribosomal protein S10
MLRIKIKCQSYNIVLLNKYINKILAKVKIFNFIFDANNSKYNKVNMPIKIKKFTVLKSAHVHKKAREQFELKIYTKIIFLNILLTDNSYVYFFNRFLYFCKSSSTGIDCQIKYSRIK